MQRLEVSGAVRDIYITLVNWGLNLCNSITLKFVVSDGRHNVTLRHFVLLSFSLHSCHHRVAGTATDTRIAPSVTSTVTSPRLQQRSSFIPTLRDHMNYPYFSTRSQAIRGRAFAQEDSGCVSVQHVCLLNIVLVAKPDVSFRKLAPNTKVYVSYHWNTYFQLTIGCLEQNCFYEEQNTTFR
jgi:hypothetical protein